MTAARIAADGSHGENAAAPPRRLMAPMLAFSAFGYVLPGLVLVLLSLGANRGRVFEFAALDLSRFQTLLADAYFLRALAQTLLLGALVGALTALLGYPIAYCLGRSRSRLRHGLFFLALLPMMVGSNMLALGWLVILGREGVVNAVLSWLGIVDQPLRLVFGWPSVVIALVNDTLAFMVLPIAGVLKSIDPALERAARNLGAGPARTFVTVTLPLSLEGVAAGFLIVFMLSLGALVLPMVLGSQSVVVLPILIYQQITVAFDPNAASAMAVVLLAVSLAILFLQLRFFRVRP
ncbi:MAG: ABC transporter permease [Alphaproteobacteria bacterium]